MADDLAAQVAKELRFRTWYADVAKQLRLDPNPDAKDHHYDYRSFYDSVLAGQSLPPTVPGGHFPSDFKTDDHPRMFMQDRAGRLYDTRTATYTNGQAVPDAEMIWGESRPSIPERAAAAVSAPVQDLLDHDEAIRRRQLLNALYASGTLKSY